MTYTALYRRYRPHKFNDLIGQEHISRVLSAAVLRGGLVHAYLFTGPRGTGKTSAARILARAVNCHQPTETGDPCEACPACLRSRAGESMDIIEIDAASNRGIDEIRDLRERVKYAPAQEKRKIYIIDEVHMLTAEAFNALLKTLEEPPEHVLFIFATTEPHKLPLPVLSRCQRFDFRRISDADIEKHVLNIAKLEQIPLDPEAARLLARKAEGGMRDAVSLLDQCAAVGAGRVDEAAVTALLGVADRAFIANMLRLLLERDIPGLLAAVEALVQEGKDLRQALADLLETTRDTLLPALSGQALTGWEQYRPAAFIHILQELADVDGKMRYAMAPRITLELALIRVCGAAALEAELASSQPQPTPKPEAKPQPAPKAEPKPEVKPKAEPQPEVKQPAPGMPDIEAIRAAWPEILRRLESRNAGAAGLMQDAVPSRMEGRRLLLDLPPDLGLMLDSVNKPGQYKTLIENAVNGVCRSSVSVQAFAGEARPEAADEDAPPADQDAPVEEPSLFE